MFEQALVVELQKSAVCSLNRLRLLLPEVDSSISSSLIQLKRHVRVKEFKESHAFWFASSCSHYHCAVYEL